MTNKDLVTYIKSLQTGEMNAFDPIYHETKKLVYYTVFAILKDASISEDIMQETYLKMLEKIHSFKRNVSVKSWITTIARNLAINEFNKRKRELQIDVTDNEIIFGTVDSNSEKELIIRDILSSLNDTERDIVIYHIVSDLTFKEISNILDIPQGTVSWKYSEAIKKLKSYEESR